jgi:sulfur transfer protein SufE
VSEDDLIFRFKTEVLDAGPESALPNRLSDFWLDELSNQADSAFEGIEDARATEVIAAIIHLLLGKSSAQEISVSEDELLSHLQRYRIELGLEKISRRTDVSVEAATLESIFTDRTVSFTQGS